jgi:hypothetical protein
MVGSVTQSIFATTLANALIGAQADPSVIFTL